MGDHFYFFSRDKIANNRVIYSILTVLFSIFVLNQSIEYYEHNAMPAKEPVVIGVLLFANGAFGQPMIWVIPLPKRSFSN